MQARYELDRLFADPEVLVEQPLAVRGMKKSGAGDTGHNDAYQNDLAAFEPIPR